MARDVAKRHLTQIERSFKRYQAKVGQTVTWYEYLPANSTTGPTYDEGSEGGSRQWTSGRTVPVLNLIWDRDREAPREEGLYTSGTVHLILSPRQLQQAGISDPYDNQKHLRDRFLWANNIWDVRRYQVAGRLHTQETVIGVDAQRINEEEMFGDLGFPRGPLSWQPFALNSWTQLGATSWRQLSATGLIAPYSPQPVQGFGAGGFGQ